MLQIVMRACSRRLQNLFALRQHYSTEAYSSERERQFLSRFKRGSVDLQKDEKTGLARILINQPEKKNALSGSMIINFSDIVTELEDWSTGRGVIVYGEDHTFCSGGDLDLMKEILNPTEGEKMSQYMQDVLTRLYRLPLISVAFVEGRALGGGAEIACACDFRVLGTSAAIGFVQTRLGVSPGWGGGARLVEILGRTKALRLLASGHLVKSKEAQEIGLADVVVSDGDSALEEAFGFLQTVTVGNPKATQAAKKVVVNASALNFETAAKGEREIFKTVWGSPEHLQALESGTKFSATNRT